MAQAIALFIAALSAFLSASAETVMTSSSRLVITVPNRQIVYTSRELLERPDVETLTIADESAYPRQQMTFRAVKMASLLESVSVPDDSTVEFIAIDGFTSAIRIAQLRQTSEDQSVAYLAIEDQDKKWPQQRFDAHSAGPYYLFWIRPRLSNISREQWPYRIEKIHVRGAIEELYPRIVPALSLSRTSPAAKGYTVFVNNCLPCHTLNESGPAKVGPDLNFPMSPTEYFREGILRKLIRDTQSIRRNPKTSMGRFPEQILSEEELDQLIAYLEHMAALRREDQDK
jgi:mono/diheme cytochrome c family protein